MKRSGLILLLAACAVLPPLVFVCCSGHRNLPCDIYRKGGTPCVTAHSTTRLLDSKYRGPLYQVRRDSDGQTLDILPDASGYADAAAQDRFLEGGIGRITVIYDQSGMGNDLVQAGPGTFLGPETGGFNTLPIADMAPVLIDGHKAYGAYIMPGMGFRCNNARGLAINDEPEGIYYVIDGMHFDSGCCFDYGNSSTNGRAVGTGTMETTYYGISTAWGSGNGDGPWIMADMEAGLFSGYNAKKNDVPSITDWQFVSVFVNGGGGNKWDLRGGDATTEDLMVFYSGVRPHSPESDAYYPMHKKGGMLLGNGGDNGNGSAGTFFEGVMTVGYPTDETIAKVQQSIASARYTEYPLSVSRITSFVPGQSSEVSVAFVNTTGKPVKNLSFDISLPDGWKCENANGGVGKLDPSGNASALFTVTAPAGRSAGMARVTASWKGGSVSVSERVRSADPVKVNEIGFMADGGTFVELYNVGGSAANLSGLELQVRRSGWAPVTALTLPAGTVLEAGDYLVLGQSKLALTAPAPAGSSQVFLAGGPASGSLKSATVKIADKFYNIKGEGSLASDPTTVFIPVSTGPWLDFPAGTTNLPVASVAGFAPGQGMGIDLGGRYEVVTVTEVGTPSTQSVLSQEAKAGDTQLVIETTFALTPGSKVTVDTGDRTEVVTVKTLVKSSDPPAPRRFGQQQAVHEPGIIELTEPLKKDHMLSVDVSCPGTGVSFTPATKYAHRSGEAVQALGAPFTLDKPLDKDAAAWQAVGLGMKDYIFEPSDIPYGYGLSATAGSVALVDPASGAVLDAVVYGSQQSNSSANGTIASPELATLEGVQDGGGCIAVLPPAPRGGFGPRGPVPAAPASRSLVRLPDGADADMLCRDFRLTQAPSAGASNVLVEPTPPARR